MILLRIEKREVIICNPTSIPIAWKCEVEELMKETGFAVYPTAGTLEPFNAIARIIVEYTAPPSPRKISIKKALRFAATDTREISDPVLIHPSVSIQVEAVDPAFDIVMPDGLSASVFING